VQVVAQHAQVRIACALASPCGGGQCSGVGVHRSARPRESVLAKHRCPKPGPQCYVGILSLFSRRHACVQSPFTGILSRTSVLTLCVTPPVLIAPASRWLLTVANLTPARVVVCYVARSSWCVHSGCALSSVLCGWHIPGRQAMQGMQTCELANRGCASMCKHVLWRVFMAKSARQHALHCLRSATCL
jgi:hypothetical protein